MKKLFVEDVQVGVSKGGMACGPMSGCVVVEIRLRDMEEGTVKYHSLTEVEGIPNFFETEISTYDQQIADDPNDEDFWNMLSEHSVGDFGDYRDFFDDQEEIAANDPERLLVWKYLVSLVRADWNEIDTMKAQSIGKCLGDFEIPVCDLEQDWLDDNADDEEDE